MGLLENENLASQPSSPKILPLHTGYNTWHCVVMGGSNDYHMEYIGNKGILPRPTEAAAMVAAGVAETPETYLLCSCKCQLQIATQFMVRAVRID